MPDVSVIIPVYNKADTIGRTLASVRAQSHADWQAIMVDDGSTDASVAAARKELSDDPRISLIQQDNSGAGSARNTGLRAATGEWILFLDADDALSPHHLATMLAEAARTPEAGLLHCGWRRWLDGQRWWTEHPAVKLDNPFATAARTCPFAIHSALVRREVIERAGGFDPALRICEDWDLWQRIARLGVRFAPVQGTWAEVHTQRHSLSSDSAKHLADGLSVIRRGHAPDPRIATPASKYAAGLDPAGLAPASWHHAIWAAGAMAGRGGDPIPLLENVDLPVPPGLDGRVLAAILEDGLVVGACTPSPPWPALWTAVETDVKRIADWLSNHGPTPLLGAALLRNLEARICDSLPGDVSASIGGTRQESIDLANGCPNPDVQGISRLQIVLRHSGGELGRLNLPVLGALSDRKLAEIILALVDPADLRPLLLKRFKGAGMFRPWRGLRRTWGRWQRLRPRTGQYAHPIQLADVLDLLMPSMSGKPHQDTAAIIGRIVAEEQTKATEAASLQRAVTGGARTGPAAGEYVDYTSQEYWEGIYSNRDPWDYSNNYEALKYDQTIALLGERRFEDALELACAEGEFTRRLAKIADRVLATDIAPSAVDRAAEKLADLPNIATARLDLLTESPPGQYDLIVCSEVLYYLDGDDALGRVVAKVSEHLKPGGWFVTAHANLLVDEPDRTGFGWPHPFGSKGIGDGFASHPQLRLAAEFHTPLYRILRFEKDSGNESPPTERIFGEAARPLPRRIAAQVRWRGGAEIPVAGQWHDFPALMYHRIARDGPQGLAQWRTNPDDFESQLAWLRENGWRGITLPRLERALHWGEPLPERSVLLTFDDATRDFLDHALPLLHRYEFPATLFVPTDKVGGVADWDKAYGEPASLLNWDEIDSIRHCDVSIASHGAAHVPLTVLSSEEAVRDLGRAKAVLSARLDMPIEAIAYPFGDFDGFVRDLGSMAGYKFGFTCEAGLIGNASDSMALPRQEVRGGISIDQFSALLTP